MHDPLQEKDSSSLQQLCKELQLTFTASFMHYPLIAQKRALIPYAFAKSKRILPLMEKEGTLWVGLDDPFNLEAVEEIALLRGQIITEVISTEEALDAAIESVFSQKKEETSLFIEEMTKGSSPSSSPKEGYDLLEEVVDAPVIRLLNLILSEAIYQKASDIHFEPSSQGLLVRYRIDGVLQKRHKPPAELELSLISRIKVLANLDIAEKRLPQDGRIKLHIAEREIDFRVSTVPVSDGERVVLRILDKSNMPLGLKNLGMPPSIYTSFKELIHLSEGMILVTGPTGSGKTTTLYSAVSDLSSSEMNIMTIEDPVEYKLGHIAQMNINPKIPLTFATGLRHILRQDPDVIMVGEIRDQETAEIGIQASLTGHLVFTTLHTNDAPSAITRLIDMGIEPYLLASTVVGVLAQRLIRSNCPLCIHPYTPLKEELDYLGLESWEGTFYRGKGCANCFGVGYKGRMALYELLLMTPQLKEEVLKTGSSSHLRKVALEQGMKPLLTSGILAVQSGKTTPSEVIRVTRTYARL
ncbi:MAG: ATPase, T2SS/T4P/T4SS family [Candidatus Rhabdochlamydia sp.]